VAHSERGACCKAVSGVTSISPIHGFAALLFMMAVSEATEKSSEPNISNLFAAFVAYHRTARCMAVVWCVVTVNGVQVCMGARTRQKYPSSASLANNHDTFLS
jgi:hypothetical protein